jgi:6-phospho-3-hexuloisomerase
MENSIKSNLNIILNEISRITSRSEFDNVEKFINQIVLAEKIVCVGAGRVGISMRAFSKRLKHLGKESYFISDEVLPKFGGGDLMIVGSGSGETASILTLSKKCKEYKTNLILITANPKSSIAELSDVQVVLNFQVRDSIQPMTTLFEQTLYLTLDAIVLELMKILKIEEKQMRELHNVFE